MSQTETCAVCELGRAALVEQQVTFALLHKTGHYSLSEYRCDTCGESYVHEDQGRSNEANERLAKRRLLRRIGSAELKAARELARATQSEMEVALGLGKNVLARWETGQRVIPAYIQTMVRLVALNPSAIQTLREGLGGVQRSDECVFMHAFIPSHEHILPTALGGVISGSVTTYRPSVAFTPANQQGEAA